MPDHAAPDVLLPVFLLPGVFPLPLLVFPLQDVLPLHLPVFQLPDALLLLFLLRQGVLLQRRRLRNVPLRLNGHFHYFLPRNVLLHLRLRSFLICP
ncbi:MAG: hypothetical protein LUC95_06055 [Lachnospiraceae bacterium]|nr:hypothetical protein [Lachnospiraceae bacterium]